MKSVCFVACLAISALQPSTVFPDSQYPHYWVNTDTVLRLALTAVTEQYPQLSTDEFKLSNGIEITCWPTHIGEVVPPAELDFKPCTASIKFELNSSTLARDYVDEVGQCRRTIPSEIQVGFLRDGKGGLSLSPLRTGEDPVIECQNKPVNDLSYSQELQFNATLFQVDTKRLLGALVEEAISRYSDLSRDELSLRHFIQIECDVIADGDVGSAGDIEFAPCEAIAAFRAESSIIELKYVDAEGNCKILRGPETVKVRTGGQAFESSSSRGNFSATQELVVECTKEFDDADRWPTP